MRTRPHSWAFEILAIELGGNRVVPFEEDTAPQPPPPIRDVREAWRLVAEWLRANQVEYRTFRSVYLGKRRSEQERTPVIHLYHVDTTRDLEPLMELARERSFSIVIHAE